MNLTVIISQECNLRCTFCTVDKDVKVQLSEAQIDEIKAWADTQDLDNVILFGGEPLMFLAKVRRLYGIKCRQFVVLTNGTRLTDEAEAWLTAHPEVYVTVAIDGPPEVHKKQRGSFHIPVDRLRALPNGMGVDFTLTLDNLPHFADSIRWLVERGFSSFYVNFVRERPYGADDLAEYQAQLETLADFLVDRDVRFNHFEDVKAPGELYCNLGREDLSIGADGKPYLCYAFATMPEHRKDPRSAPLADRLPGYEEETTPIVLGDSVRDFTRAPFVYRRQCMECPARAYCVMCPASHYFTHGNGNAVPAWFCQAMFIKRAVQRDFMVRRARRLGLEPPESVLPEHRFAAPAAGPGEASGFGLRASDGEGLQTSGFGPDRRASDPEARSLEPEAWSLKPEAWSLEPEGAPPSALRPPPSRGPHGAHCG